MKELIRNIKTPKVPGASDVHGSAVFREAHAEGKLKEMAEEDIAVTRDFILQKYSVNPDHVLIVPPISGSARPQHEIRAFSILSDSANPHSNFYAEGHTAHSVLNNLLVETFSEKIGTTDFGDLVDDETLTLRKPWVTRKGFLDPHHNGFREFPAIRRELITQLERYKHLNGLSEEEIHQMERGEHDLPNWFLSADSSKE